MISGVRNSLEDILVSFLKGTGIPCQDSFEPAVSSGLIPSSIDLSLINDPSFCPCMFHIAATGTNSIHFGKKLKVGRRMNIR